MVTGYGGTYRGVVVDDIDPIQQHRLQVFVPEVFGDASVWAVASLNGPGPTLPAVGDPVWVSFERGDTDYPVWETSADATSNDAASGFIGKYRGVVLGNVDPMESNRLEVTVPEVDPSAAWAEPSPDARDSDPPDVGSNVWIEYDNGDPAHPRWVGLA